MQFDNFRRASHDAECDGFESDLGVKPHSAYTMASGTVFCHILCSVFGVRYGTADEMFDLLADSRVGCFLL